MERSDLVKHILRHSNYGSERNSAKGRGWAPANVALCKYWGKRDPELNLPVTSSLSLSLGTKGTVTQVCHEEQESYVINGQVVAGASGFAKRLKNFLDLLRPQGVHYKITIATNIPLAAGLASSAAGFASLVQALNQLYGWNLTKRELSILARLGSGSAARSLFTGFVEWQRGDSYTGLDSYAVPLEYVWPQLRVGILTISSAEKPLSSTVAMQRTVTSSPLYATWPARVTQDLAAIKVALAHKDFVSMGQIAEGNAIAMHTLMERAEPPIVYSLPATKAAIAQVTELRLAGVPLFFTQDAGPNLQLLFLAQDEAAVVDAFPELEIVLPFGASREEQVIWVDHHDVAIGTGEKLATHIKGQLHRAFSVCIVRKRRDKIELLLQQRSATKYHSANLWSNSCCGHPRPGEELVAAATRRLEEEMGFKAELRQIGEFQYSAEFPEVGLKENEFDHLLLGFTNLTSFPLNLAEVQAYCWMPIDALVLELQEHPEKYSVWLPQVVHLLKLKLAELGEER